jgi:predicted lipoprotein with Yx(FWY)xxD motif
MLALKRLALVVSVLYIILLLASCGSTATVSPATTSSSAYKSVSATSVASTQAVQSAQASNSVVKTATLLVNGKSTTVLTDAQGKTLYYFTPDTSQQTACTGSCAQTWPPLLVSGTTKISAATHLPGELETYKNANGYQVIYNDHPLYTFSGDSGPGQANGEGIAGKWFVATPIIARNK